MKSSSKQGKSKFSVAKNSGGKLRRGWPGIVSLAKTFLYGSSQNSSQAKTPHVAASSTPSGRAPDEALNPVEYRWFRRDELVRRCIIINAAYACFTAGFETELEVVNENLEEKTKKELLKKFAYVKTYVDQINKQVNLDNALFIAQVKRSIYGKAAFEIVANNKDEPNWLLSLKSTKITPIINANWSLEGFKYDGKTKYAPNEVLFFVNLQLENDHEGLSDVEPINHACQARNNLLKNDFPEITRKLWAPYALLEADTSSMSDTEETKFLQEASEKANAGKSLVFNTSVKGQVIDLNVNLSGLVHLMDKLEETIIRAFGTPRFLINKTPENRATAFVEFESYIEGPIANIQRYFKRELEGQWYNRLVKLALKNNNYTKEAPVQIKHKWNTIRASDFNDLVNAANILYGQGFGLLGEHPELIFDMLGLDKTVLTKTQSSNPKETVQAPNSEGQIEEETVDAASKI